MSFKDFAVSKLAEAQKSFGTYTYGDKGAREVMDLGELVEALRKESPEVGISQLKQLMKDTSTDLDPGQLVMELLCHVQEDGHFGPYFEDEALLDECGF